jgi:hypothetical protein
MARKLTSLGAVTVANVTAPAPGSTISNTPAHIRQVAQALPLVMTAQEFCEHMRMSMGQFRRLVASGEIKAHRRVRNGSSRVIVLRGAAEEYMLSLERA